MKFKITLLVLLVVCHPNKESNSVVVRVKQIHLVQLGSIKREHPSPEVVTEPSGTEVFEWDVNSLPFLTSLHFERNLPRIDQPCVRGVANSHLVDQILIR